MRAKELATFIKKREAARLKKEQGVKIPPAMRDDIISRYRFCNMIRADDRVTRWIFENWLDWFGGEDELWFVAIIGRLLNNPDSLTAVRDVVLPWKPKLFIKILQKRAKEGLKNFNPAYIVSTNGRKMDKVEYITTLILDPLWRARKSFRPKQVNKAPGAEAWEPLSSYHARLTAAQGLGSFMAAQVIADIKYFPPYATAEEHASLHTAEDWWTFAASGPGSRRGLNVILDRDMDAPWTEAAWRREFAVLYKQIMPMLPSELRARMTGQDLQNCLCEYSKYYKVVANLGRPKQIYTPYAEAS